VLSYQEMKVVKEYANLQYSVKNRAKRVDLDFILTAHITDAIIAFREVCFVVLVPFCHYLLCEG
jgi:hypothetical protein